MKVEMFALCDAATDCGGKLNILGAFDTISAREVPVVHPQCAVALRLRFSQIEQGSHKMRLNFVDEDGNMVISPLDASVQVNFAQSDAPRSSSINMVLNIQRLKLEEYGEYAIDLAVDGRQEVSLPLFVRNPQIQN